MVHRKERVESFLKRLVREFIFKHADMGGAEIIITKIETLSNFKNAIIYVMVYPAEKENATLKKLKSLKSGLHKEAGKKLKMRFVPYFDFKIDEGEKIRKRIEGILDKLNKLDE